MGTYQLLEHNCSAEEAIQKTTATNVDIIPAHIDLVAIEIELVNMDTTRVYAQASHRIRKI